ncbi:Asp-tRNA(Asn)/Glu-tRNA(Gln) amidotransferase subunit GatC [Mycoplasma sp. 332]|uniref:Asp-tRNA(Asn)/Glu-tRNA(Gln) amidotransferase subunit GatC n=1 Tax=Mycoplasma sp. 332 TaxID=3458236 RepID=UPI004034F819
MNDEELKTIANNLLLDPSDEVINMAKKLLDSINQSLTDLDEINLANIKPLSHINESKISFNDLRDDEICDCTKIDKEKLLKNAYNSNEDLVIMKRVVHEE